MKTFVIKVGTQTLTTPAGLLDVSLLADLIAQIVTLKQQGHFVVLVSSGAVSTGRSLLANRSPLQTNNVINEKQILAAIGQTYLMQAYQKILDRHAMQSAQILLTKQDFITRHHYQNIAHLFESLRQQAFILPIVNENDSVAIQELMFTDNDELAGLLAAQLSADRLILLTNVDGVYDRAPSQPDASIIPVIDPANKNMPSLTAEKSALGRGGMQSKLTTARKMSGLGITTHIANGRTPHIMTRLVNDEAVGTTILPQRKKSSVKRWLAITPQTQDHGLMTPNVTANVCLAEQLRDPDKTLSILPVGIIGVTGEFTKGDRVHVLSEDLELLAIGLARYDSATLISRLGQQKQPVFLHTDTLYRTVLS